MNRRMISLTLGSLMVTFMASGRPASAQLVILPALSGGISASTSKGWGPTAISFGGVTCVGCGVPGVPNTYYGAEVGLNTQGSVGVNAFANVTTGALNIRLNQNSSFSANNTYGRFDFNYAQNTGRATFTQAAGSASAGVGASLAFDNSIYGQVCVIGCGSFGTTLGSVNTSFTALGYNTAGTGAVTIAGATLNSVNGRTQTFKQGSTVFGTASLTAPAGLVGGHSELGGFEYANATSTVGVVSLNLTNIATKLGNLPPLNGSYGFQSLSVGYNLLTASLNLTSGVTLYTSLTQQFSANPIISFYDKYNNPISPTFRSNLLYDSSTSFHSIDMNRLDDYFLPLSNWKAGNYAKVTTSYFLQATQQAYLTLSGSILLSALGVEYNGNHYDTFSDNYPIFEVSQLAFDKNTSYFGSYSSKYTFPTSQANAARFGADFASVAGVPEPTTWVMMSAGVGFAGVALRRRRSALSGA